MQNKALVYGFAGIFVAASLLMTACTQGGTSPAGGHGDSSKSVSGQDLLKRGEYLVTTMGCNDCHTPKRMGPRGPELIPELLLSGYPAERGIPPFDSKLTEQGYAMMVPDLTAAKGPWGISFAANLTPDETGIGSWTEEQFKKALKEGKYKGMDNSRMLLPPMPWFNFVNLSDEDAHAMFAYLKSLKPVKNQVPDPVLAAMPPAPAAPH